MLRKPSFLLVLGLLWSYGLLAQTFPAKRPCATLPERSEWLQRFQARGPQPELRGQTLYVGVAVHLVGQNDGTGYLAEHQLLDAFCRLNELFAPANIQFVLQGAPSYLTNTSFYNHTDLRPALAAFQKFNRARAVNVYFVENALDACGYTYRNEGSGVAIVLAKSCTDGKNANWAHEMGHFFSLPHTFHGWENYNFDFSQPAPTTMGGVRVELADGSNCAVAGDGFCDTRADYLGGRWYCGTNSSTGMIPQFDPRGSMFYSDGSQIMSYAMDPCPQRFSPDQRTAMNNYLGEQRPDLLYPNPGESAALGSAVTLLQPLARQFIPTYDSVAFTWRPAAQAQGYLIELSPVINFALVSNRYLTSDTSLLVRNLRMGRTYYWRVRPYSRTNTCRTYSAAGTFSTGMLTPIEHFASGTALSVFPNPLAGPASLNLRIQTPLAFTGTAHLLDPLGRVLQTWPVECQSGFNQQELPLDPVPPGIYVLQLRAGSRRWSTNLIRTP